MCSYVGKTTCVHLIGPLYLQPVSTIQHVCNLTEILPNIIYPLYLLGSGDLCEELWPSFSLFGH